MERLEVTQDIYGGITIRSDCLPNSPSVFSSLLECSLSAWKSANVQQVWLPLPIEYAGLISMATSLGFRFHHCSESELILVKRLVENAPIPSGATHLIGAGAVVLSEQRELLVVLENYEYRSGRFKLPGGLLDPSEHIADAVMREVLEETGIETAFDSLLCLTHLHQWHFGKSTIYMVCRLHPLTSEITIGQTEIAQARWMPVSEFLGSDEVIPYNKKIVAATLKAPGLKRSVIEGFEVDRSRFEAYFP